MANNDALIVPKYQTSVLPVLTAEMNWGTWVKFSIQIGKPVDDPFLWSPTNPGMLVKKYSNGGPLQFTYVWYTLAAYTAAGIYPAIRSTFHDILMEDEKSEEDLLGQ